MSENILNFYGIIFSTEVTVLGVITAVIFVFIQLVYSSFSYGGIRFLFRNPYFIIFAIFGAVSLLSSIGGIISLSFSNNSAVNETTKIIAGFFSNQIVAVMCLLFFLLSIGSFLILVSKNLKYLHPKTFLLLSKNSISYKSMSNYLFKKYGFPVLSNLNIVDIMRISDRDDILARGAKAEIGFDKLTDEENALYEKKKEKFNAANRRYKDEIDKLKRRGESCSDPFIPINSVLMQAIKKYDLSTVNEVEKVVSAISRDFINGYKISSAKWDDRFNPYQEHITSFADYLVEFLSTNLEISKIQHFRSGNLAILEISKNIADKMLKSNEISGLIKITDFWKNTADQSMESTLGLFQRVMDYYLQTCKSLFELNEQSMLDSICKDVGWIGERLLLKQSVEDKPLMPNDDYETNYDGFMNCLLSIGSLYEYDHPDWYPLVYFGAVDGVLRSIIRNHKQMGMEQGVEHDVFKLIYIYYTFFEKAFEKKNDNGAALALLNLRQAYEILKDEKIEKSAQQAIRLIVTMGAITSKHKDRKGFMDKPIYSELMETLKESIYGKAIESEMQEVGIKYCHRSDPDPVWEYVKELAAARKTNFGFMFDWETGKTYSNDDPRRR